MEWTGFHGGLLFIEFWVRMKGILGIQGCVVVCVNAGGAIRRTEETVLLSSRFDVDIASPLQIKRYNRLFPISIVSLVHSRRVHGSLLIAYSQGGSTSAVLWSSL